MYCFYLCAGEALLVVGGLLCHLLLSLEDAALAPEKRQKNIVFVNVWLPFLMIFYIQFDLKIGLRALFQLFLGSSFVPRAHVWIPLVALYGRHVRRVQVGLGLVAVLVGVAQLAVDLRVRALSAKLVVKGALALRMNYFIKGFFS